MHYRDANRPELAGTPRPTERRYEAGTGNAGVDGYTTIARVPRIPRMGPLSHGPREEMMPAAKADRIESFYEDMPAMPDS